MNKIFHHPHPGKLVKSILIEGAGLSITDAASHLGITRVSLSKLLNGHCGLSSEMAVRLSIALNTSIDVWLNLQRNYELWLLEKLRSKLKREVSRVGNARSLHSKKYGGKSSGKHF